MADENRDYALEGAGNQAEISAPDLPYLPIDPPGYRPNIGLIGCGGISEYHLKSYRSAGYNVVALCNRTEDKAHKRQQVYFPQADVYTDYRHLLKRDDIEVVDVATHPPERVRILEDAIDAGKHILSQKPFVTNLDVGELLVERADRRGVRLAVNQNGRWAPHFSYLRHAIAADLIGDVFAVHGSTHWNHDWIAETPFNDLSNMIYCDFGIHWFDILCCFFKAELPTSIFATLTRSPHQRAREPLLGQALVQFENAQASLVFDGNVSAGPQHRTYIAGTRGTLLSSGPGITEQSVTLSTESGIATPVLEGSWFEQGFHGAMAELINAIAENREPEHSGADNLRALKLCFAAVASARLGEPVRPGAVRRLEP